MQWCVGSPHESLSLGCSGALPILKTWQHALSNCLAMDQMMGYNKLTKYLEDLPTETFYLYIYIYIYIYQGEPWDIPVYVALIHDTCILAYVVEFHVEVQPKSLHRENWDLSLCRSRCTNCAIYMLLSLSGIFSSSKCSRISCHTYFRYCMYINPRNR
jgi:hypothetical protein